MSRRAATCATAPQVGFDLPGLDGVSSPARISGGGGVFVVELDNVAALAGAARNVVVHHAAAELARRDHTLRVEHDGLHVLSIGAVDAPWRQRRLTGSRHVRLGSWSGAATVPARH